MLDTFQYLLKIRESSHVLLLNYLVLLPFRPNLLTREIPAIHPRKRDQKNQVAFSDEINFPDLLRDYRRLFICSSLLGGEGGDREIMSPTLLAHLIY